MEENETTPPPLEELQKSLEECQDKYLRALAESENTRKRMLKEKLEASKYAEEEVLLEFLQPIDQFEQALTLAANSSSEVKNWAVGFDMILNQFKQILTNFSITPFDAEGREFDPHFHEAVEVEEREDVESGTILQQFVKGYRLGDKVLRVARVKVAKKKESANGEEEIR